jgi:uncharacterized protein (DUF1697 family)
MARFVALLGGINLGNRRLTMDRLRAAVADLGYEEVSTFIASGNVLFSAPAVRDGGDRYAAHLADGLAAAFGWPVPTFVRPAREFLAAVDLRPFGPGEDGVTHYIAFCGAPPVFDTDAAATETDRFVVHGRDVHWRIEGKTMDSRVTLPKLGKLIGQQCTTRNITSAERMAELLR